MFVTLRRLLILITLTCSHSSYAIDKIVKDNKINESIEVLRYDAFKPLNIQETDETKGKMGPLITGAIGALGGASISIATDISANQPINWTNAGINAGAGFVMGATGNIFGGVSGQLAGIALGTSTYGALNAGFGSSGGGGGCSSSCHSVSH